MVVSVLCELCPKFKVHSKCFEQKKYQRYQAGSFLAQSHSVNLQNCDVDSKMYQESLSESLRLI